MIYTLLIDRLRRSDAADDGPPTEDDGRPQETEARTRTHPVLRRLAGLLAGVVVTVALRRLRSSLRGREQRAARGDSPSDGRTKGGVGRRLARRLAMMVATTVVLAVLRRVVRRVVRR